MWICHRCDNPACVNPDHLFVGTAKDNAKDREAKGRGGAQKVSPEARAKSAATHRATNSAKRPEMVKTVQIIREMRAKGMGLNKISETLGIHKRTVKRIVDKRYYADVT